MQYQRIKENKKDTLKAKDLYDPVIRVSFYNTYYQNNLYFFLESFFCFTFSIFAFLISFNLGSFLVCCSFLSALAVFRSTDFGAEDLFASDCEILCSSSDRLALYFSVIGSEYRDM